MSQAGSYGSAESHSTTESFDQSGDDLGEGASVIGRPLDALANDPTIR